MSKFAIDTAEEILNEMHRIKTRLGYLDDMHESSLLDDRMEIGAWQYVDRAMRRLEEYVWELKENE